MQVRQVQKPLCLELLVRDLQYRPGPHPWSHKNVDGYVNCGLARTSHPGDHDACNLRSLGARTANRSTKTIPIIPTTAAAWGALQTSAIAPEDMLPKAKA